MADLNASRVALRPGALFGALYLIAMLTAVALMVLAFIHIGRAPEPAEFRVTRPRASWIPAPRYPERALVRLEQTDDHP